jgi:hypothetical protein
MFGMLKVILGGDRVAGCLRIARKLHVLFRDMSGVAADLHFRSVGLVDASHRVMTLAVPVVVVNVIVIIVTSTHPLVLTVSHDLSVYDP